MKRFNVTGLCVEEKHYMVDIGKKIKETMEFIGRGQYFTINRARQYGKTTILFHLSKALQSEYTCINISFEGVGEKMFESPLAFCRRFLLHVSKSLDHVDHDYAKQWPDDSVTDFDLLGYHIEKLCRNRKVVLLVDEVDRTSNNRVFLHFLGMLRSKYLARESGYANTFHSVVLAGVYDIKNIKLKMMEEGSLIPSEAENKIYNSPWNIAANFTVDMSFNPAEIATMLESYEKDHHTGMGIMAISEEIYGYTSGYPFLVSRICQCIDEELGKAWSVLGVRDAVKVLLSENNTLFDDVFKNLENNNHLHDMVYELLILGEEKPYVIFDSVVSIGIRYGFFKSLNGNNRLAISNRIFELIMTDYFIAKDLRKNKKVTGVIQHDVVCDSGFDMELCIRKFAGHYSEIYNEQDVEFLERHGRLLFLSYLKPLINGQGFYHIESQFTDLRRMDIVVDFGRQQFIIELKVWRGEQYQAEAYKQLCAYLGSKHTGEGYLLTFDFRKRSNKTPKAEWIEAGDKRIFDVIV